VFVSHNLGVVWWFCSRVAVMYLGRVVESGPVARVFGAPRHPYTRILRDASAIPDPGLRGQMQRIVAEIPSAANPPAEMPLSPPLPPRIRRVSHGVSGMASRW
jgi:ABC-type dipeptide/oligopeptide/nickel transport system ATPase component